MFRITLLLISILHVDSLNYGPVPRYTVRARCCLKPNFDADPSETLYGTVSFQQDLYEDLVVSVRICGFNQFDTQRYHGIHVHQNGMLVQATNGGGVNCSSAGPHYNPYGTNHGAPEGSISDRHVGDFGNIYEDDSGCVITTYQDRIASIVARSPRNILNKAIVVHAGRDDLGRGNNAGSLRTGNAGARLACCTILQTPSY